MGINVRTRRTDEPNLKALLKSAGLSRGRYTTNCYNLREGTGRLSEEQKTAARDKVEELYPHSMVADCINGYACAGEISDCFEMTEELRECSESLPGIIFIVEGTNSREKLLYASVILGGECHSFTDI